ncbi:MAG: hypothetical protein WC901_05810 [Candidatus Margulisiibacteriota bacterium]
MPAKKAKLFNRKLIKLKPLAQREHGLNLSAIFSLRPVPITAKQKAFNALAQKVILAKRQNAAVIFMLGGHVIRAGVQNYIIDLMRRGYISGLATNGAGMIHDFEFALIGATTESVAKYIRAGQFGLWEETGKLNDIINRAYSQDKLLGMGAAVGREILNGKYPHKAISLFSEGYRLNVPVTVHVGIGYDIIHAHPNCDGAASGALSYNDFLTFAALLQKLENGVVMNFGSAVMAPEVYLKALSMVRNVAKQRGKKVKNFTVLVCDLHSLPADYRKEAAQSCENYYFRPWKTMLVRTVADGGDSYYINGKHADTIPSLWQAINMAEKSLAKI